MDPKLLDYVKNSLRQGFTQTTIEQNLLQAGWNIQDVKQAFNEISNTNGGIESVKPWFLGPKAIVTSLILILLMAGLIAIFFFWKQKQNQIQDQAKTNPQSVPVDQSILNHEGSASLSNNFAECFKTIQIPAEYPTVLTPDIPTGVIPDLAPVNIGNYYRLTLELPDKNQWNSLYSGQPIQVKSGLGASYTADKNQGGRDLELNLTEYIETQKEDFDFYIKLIEDKSALAEFQKGNDPNTANPTFYYQKEVGGLKYLFDEEPKNEFSGGHSSIIAGVKERSLLVSFGFQKFEPKAEEIFKTWLSSVCPN